VSPRLSEFRGLWGRWPWSGRGGQGADAGEDFVDQVVSGRRAEDERAGVVDHPGGDADQSVPQGGDHGLAAVDAVPEQSPAESGGGGELVQPTGDAGREQRPHIQAVLTCGYPEGR
jgi:hypothetical protein